MPNKNYENLISVFKREKIVAPDFFIEDWKKSFFSIFTLGMRSYLNFNGWLPVCFVFLKNKIKKLVFSHPFCIKIRIAFVSYLAVILFFDHSMNFIRLNRHVILLESIWSDWNSSKINKIEILAIDVHYCHWKPFFKCCGKTLMPISSILMKN